MLIFLREKLEKCYFHYFKRIAMTKTSINSPLYMIGAKAQNRQALAIALTVAATHMNDLRRRFFSLV